MARINTDRPTHLAGRTRQRERFRRAGLEFTKQWAAFPLDALQPDQVRRIQDQDDEIESRLCTAAEASALTQGRELNDGADRAQLMQQLEAANRRVAELEATVETLQLKLRGDRAPAEGQPAPGQAPPLPTPGVRQGS